ncbi:MAG: fibrillarin-like rRNA/tRNA 2'-O-methyltransferase [Methanomassiliicoccaceae archaeon]|nr:fibrillarin-like rRNA/tRNA 2'-O-methyltransferase [Methanomassiliicoccaceae archaeon]
MPVSDDNIEYIDGRPATLSFDPGRRVYGERLSNVSGKEYRIWDPRRSKLSAYICAGGEHFPFTRESNVLYLGAASGTTASHISDIVTGGKIFCVEISQRTFRDLVKVCDHRKNMIPVLGDAASPDSYRFAVDNVNVVYQDVAQKGQADMLADNMECFSARYGMVSIKARSEDVTAQPETIFQKARERLEERDLRILDAMSLEPYENAHAMIVVEALQ